jgi:hypothetical protein
MADTFRRKFKFRTIPTAAAPPDLQITTASIDSGTQNTVYNFAMTASGGSGGNVWTVSAGSLPTGLTLSSDGVLSGTPTVVQTAVFTLLVTDTALDTDSQPYNLTISDDEQAVLGGTNHSYYTTLGARPDFHLQYSLRDATENNTVLSDVNPNPANFYAPSTDWDGQRQDGIKMLIPAFQPTGNPNVRLTAALDELAAGTTDTIFYTSNFDAAGARAFKFEGSDEIMVSLGDTSPLQTNVLRGCFGTTPTTHPSGALLYVTSNSLWTNSGLNIPFLSTPTETACYFATVDAYYTDSWQNMDEPTRTDGVFGNTTAEPSILSSLKHWQWRSRTSNAWFETRFREHGGVGANIPTDWNTYPTTRVGGIDVRNYGVQAPFSSYINDDPLRVVDNGGFTVRTGKWTRYFWILELYPDTENFINTTTLAAAINDTTGTSITLSQVGLTTENNVLWSTVYVGRTLKVDNEIMTITSATGTAPANMTCTVVRGAKSTAAATHSNGAAVQMSWDYVSLYMADEDNGPKSIYTRVPIKSYNNSSGVLTGIGPFDFEFNTSTNQCIQGRVDNGLIDLVTYVRDFSMLKVTGSTVPAAWTTTLLVKPVSV